MGSNNGGGNNENTPRCGAQLPNKPRGTTCKNVAGFKTKHHGIGRCYRHGGDTPTHNRAAEKVIARQEVQKLGLVAPDEEVMQLDPKAVLAEELYRTRKVVRGLEERINALAQIHGEMFHATGIRTGESKPHVEWVMWQEQRAHLKQVADSCHKAGIDVFYATLEKQRVEAWLMVMEKVYTALSLTEEQRKLANQTAARELRLLEANPDAVRIVS